MVETGQNAPLTQRCDCDTTCAMRAIRFGAVGVEREGVVVQREPAFLGNFFLPPLNLRVIKLFHPAALQAYQVIVM